MLPALLVVTGVAAIGPHPWPGATRPLPPPTAAPIAAPAAAPTAAPLGAPGASPGASARCVDLGGERVRVMVLDLAADPRFSSQRGALTQLVAAEAARVRGFEILSTDDVRAALDQEANRQLLGCDDNSCLAELAAALDAALLVSGRVDASSDGTPLVALTLLNTRALVVLNRVSFAWGGADDALPDVVRTAAQTLLLEPSARPPGAVQVLGAPDDATVYVEGSEGTAAAPLGGLAIGPHEVRVVAPGKQPVSVWAVVLAGATTPVEVALEDAPVSAAWWILGGAVAAVGGGALALGSALLLGKGTVEARAVVEPFGLNDVEKLPVGAR